MRTPRAFLRRIPGLRGAFHAARRMAAAARDRPPVAALDYGRRRLVVSVASPAVAHSRLHPVAKEPWTVAWLESRVRPDDVVWDVGANVGGYALIAASLGASNVVAVEPSPATFASLCENVALNGFGGVITPVPVALTAESGVVRLEQEDVRAGVTHRLSEEGGLAVVGLTLDDLVAAASLAPPTLLKLDVDGAEAAVLAGAPATLARPELRSLLVEVEAESERDLLRRTEGAGLALVERYDSRDGVPLHGIWYGVFERR